MRSDFLLVNKEWKHIKSISKDFFKLLSSPEKHKIIHTEKIVFFYVENSYLVIVLDSFTLRTQYKNHAQALEVRNEIEQFLNIREFL